VIEKLFERFNAALDQQGIFANEERMVDASFVEAPRQRNTREENKQIKSGQTPEQWKVKPHKLSQKMLMPAGPRKTMLFFTDIKIM